jgi:glycerophosphoryl diester phosphodiesterase
MSASARRRRPFLDSAPPICFSHRGGAERWPENTLLAFEESLALGITYLETDVHMTRDGVLVAHHDETVDRTTNGRGRIEDFDYADLSRLDAGYRFSFDGEHFPFRGEGLFVPTLSDVFALSGKLRLNVEIKARGRGIARRLWEFVDQRGLHDRILVAAENDVQVRRFRRYSAERVATSAGQKEALKFWAMAKVGLDRIHPVAFDALQVPATYKRLTVIDKTFVRAAHRHGLQVHAWTIDDPSEMRRLLNIGVDGIISNHPERLASLKARPTGPF